MKKIVMDIETVPMIAAVFTLRNRAPINPKMILQHSFMSTVCWKEIGKKKVHSVSLLSDKERFEKDPTDDYFIAKTVHDVIAGADLLIGHNFAGFDWKVMNTRFLKHDLGPLPKTDIADTYKMATREFKFPSNKLESIADYLEFEGKMSTDANLWLDTLRGDKKAIRKTVEYCKQDIIVSEEAYLRLLPYDTRPPNLSVSDQADVDNLICPKCGSQDNMQKRGKTSCGRYQRYRCMSCGGWSRGRKNFLTKALTGSTLSEKTLVSQ